MREKPESIHVILQSSGNIHTQIPKQVSEALQASLLCASFGYNFYCHLIYRNQQANLQTHCQLR